MKNQKEYTEKEIEVKQIMKNALQMYWYNTTRKRKDLINEMLKELENTKGVI